VLKSIIAIFLFLSTFALANAFDKTLATDDTIDKIAGEYDYEQYYLWFRDGRVLGLAELGAKKASLDINNDKTLTLYLHMVDGEIKVVNGVIYYVEIKGKKGFWNAKWPDMDYNIRVDFSFNDEMITTKTKFENPKDKARYRTIEEAVLKKRTL
jgi:hypothetical protein